MGRDTRRSYGCSTPSRLQPGEFVMALRGPLRFTAALVATALALVSCGGNSSLRADLWPAVEIGNATGAPVQSDSILTRGKPAVIAVWAVWCRPCREELPRLAQVASQNPAVTVAAVNLGDDAEAVAKYTNSMGLSIAVYIDVQGRLTEELGISSVPATVFVNASGRVTEVHLGALSADELAAGVASLLTA